MKSLPIHQRGFTLIELMIASLLGLIVIATVTGVFISTYQANTQNLKVVRMEQEMRAAMTLMVRDIRRSGTRELAWQTSLLGTQNPFATNLHWTISRFDGSELVNSCVRFAYDRTADDAPNPDDVVYNEDLFGYRLRDNGIESRGRLGASCTAPVALNSWEAITDRDAWAVTWLQYTTTLEPGATGTGIRTVIVTLEGAVNTRASDATRDAGGAVLDTNDCAANTLDIVCRRLVEKVRMRNDAIL